MKPFKKLHILDYLLLFSVILGTCMAQQNRINYCGDIRTQTSFLNPNSSLSSSLLSSITLCRSQNLYLRTSLGLLQVSSVDYNARLIIISHSCSSSLQYVSPLAVTAGFPSPPEPSSLLLFNCSSRSISPFMHNCIGLHECGAAASTSSRIQEHKKMPYPCLVIEDLQKLEKGFHPEHLNCSHYSWIHRSSSDGEGYKLGTRMSFDIPHHVQNLCKECEKPNGNCGVGLKCLCHAKECKDKLISESGSIKSIDEDSHNSEAPSRAAASPLQILKVGSRLTWHPARKASLKLVHRTQMLIHEEISGKIINSKSVLEKIQLLIELNAIELSM